MRHRATTSPTFSALGQTTQPEQPRGIETRAPSNAPGIAKPSTPRPGTQDSAPSKSSAPNSPRVKKPNTSYTKPNRTPTSLALAWSPSGDEGTGVVAYDLQYIRTRKSVWFDLKILFQTVWLVLARKGAF